MSDPEQPRLYHSVYGLPRVQLLSQLASAVLSNTMLCDFTSPADNAKYAVACAEEALAMIEKGMQR